MALKMRGEVTHVYRDFEPSETFGTAFECKLPAVLTHAWAFFLGVINYALTKFRLSYRAVVL